MKTKLILASAAVLFFTAKQSSAQLSLVDSLEEMKYRREILRQTDKAYEVNMDALKATIKIDEMKKKAETASQVAKGASEDQYKSSQNTSTGDLKASKDAKKTQVKASKATSNADKANIDYVDQVKSAEKLTSESATLMEKLNVLSKKIIFVNTK